MTRVHIICEGQTEERFVKNILGDYFANKGIYLIPSLIGRPGHKGGNVKFDRLFYDIKNRLLSEKDAYCTTFFDFYRLDEKFPGKNEAILQNGSRNKSDILLKAFMDALQSKGGLEDSLWRFIPYVQLYEFESLLFSNVVTLANEIDENIFNQLQKIRVEFDSPEEINNSIETAPSKRIIKLFKQYDKVTYGSIVAHAIGLDVIRKECPLFNTWLIEIEKLIKE